MDLSIKKRARWSKEIKKKAREMRRNNLSFPEIIDTLKVPKSTLHSWVRDFGRPEKFTGEAQKLWFKEMQKLAVEANRKKYAEIYQRIAQKTQSEAKRVNLTKDLYRSILSMLYLAEGSKGRHAIISFANTDPRLVLLFITLLRNCYNLDESKIRIKLHLHDYHDESRVKNFWSNLLNIPLSKFGKTYWKQRSKERAFRRNFGGICFLKYNSVYLKEEIVQYGLALCEMITGKVAIPEIIYKA